MATNQITGSGSTLDLLEALTDAQLAEQVEYWQEQRREAGAAGEKHSAYRYGVELSLAARVLEKRSH